MNWYLAVLKNYVGFSGRARRTEYWMFTLVNVIISLVLQIIALAAHPVIYIEYIYALAVLVPGLAVLSRRLHDSGKSFWWVLIGLIPLIGAIVLLVFMCLPGTRGPNQYGSDPKEVGSYV
jgi:uncharacterized membrane protein YhaH (DUF805 family)